MSPRLTKAQQRVWLQIVNVLAAVRCLNAGQPLAKVAADANRSPATIRRWLRQAGFVKRDGHYRLP